MANTQKEEGVKPSAPRYMGIYHERIILKAIESGENTRTKIIKATKIPRTTVWDTLQRLREKGQIEAMPKIKNNKSGRKSINWKPI